MHPISFIKSLFDASVSANGSHTSDVLISDQDLLDIKLFASHGSQWQKPDHRVSELQLLGEQSSRFKGAGQEFEELRSFVQGDDFRHINWRALAKTGRFYTSLFTEERRPALYLLLDRRASMWFGTTRQLKITLAVSAAACFLYRALQAGQQLAGIVFSDNLKLFKLAQGEAAAEAVLNHARFPRQAIPLSEYAAEQSMEDVLTYVLTQVPSGSQLLIVSDFYDYNPTIRDKLFALNERHKVQLLQVVDPAELELPIGAAIHLRAADGQKVSPTQLGVGVKKAFEEKMRQRLEEIQNDSEALGLKYQRLLTNQSWKDVVI